MSHEARRVQEHEHHKQTRHDRFAKGVYGVIQQPVIPPGDPVIAELPSYTQSRHTSNSILHELRDGIDRHLNKRCFFTGVMLTPFPPLKPEGWDHNPLHKPWLGTRDHLVPARRAVPGQPAVYQNYPSTLVWCANVVNVTLGLAPLPVRVKIRSWLQTVRMVRDDATVADGANLRWLLIHYLDGFRIQGRYPWSRNAQGQWWYPHISEPFMARMWHMEQEFLMLDENQRDIWIKNFYWQF